MISHSPGRKVQIHNEERERLETRVSVVTFEGTAPHRACRFFLFFLQRHFSSIPSGKHNSLWGGLERSGINSSEGRRGAPSSCGRLPDDDSQYYQHHGHHQRQDAHLLTRLLLWTREERGYKETAKTQLQERQEPNQSPGPRAFRSWGHQCKINGKPSFLPSLSVQ